MNALFKWTDDRQNSFQAFENKVVNAPVLAHPSYNEPFSIYTEASKVGIGAVLVQNQRHVWFTSRSLQSGKLNYDIREKECLAIVHALDKFRLYIYGKDISVFTDHGNLHWLFD